MDKSLDTEESKELTDEQLDEVVGGLQGRRLEIYICSIMNQHSGSMGKYDDQGNMCDLPWRSGPA